MAPQQTFEEREGLRPVVVDLPESTWPMTTTLICVFSLLWKSLARCSDRSCAARLMISRVQSFTYPMVKVVECVVRGS